MSGGQPTSGDSGACSSRAAAGGAEQEQHAARGGASAQGAERVEEHTEMHWSRARLGVAGSAGAGCSGLVFGWRQRRREAAVVCTAERSLVWTEARRACSGAQRRSTVRGLAGCLCLSVSSTTGWIKGMVIGDGKGSEGNGRWRNRRERKIDVEVSNYFFIFLSFLPSFYFSLFFHNPLFIFSHHVLFVKCMNLVDSASSHMLVSKIKPCMCKYKQLVLARLRMAHYTSYDSRDSGLRKAGIRVREYVTIWIAVVILELIHAFRSDWRGRVCLGRGVCAGEDCVY